jgi:GDP-L-fucose synthase
VKERPAGFWEDKRVCVTGGAGLVGSVLVEELDRRGATEIFVPRRRDYDLAGREAIDRMLADARPDIVIYLAAVVGGIGANMASPGRFFYGNAMMGIQLIEQSRSWNVLRTPRSSRRRSAGAMSARSRRSGLWRRPTVPAT